MGIEVTWYGHSTLGLTVNGDRLLVDPFFTDNPAASCSADDLSRVDYILLTHGHGDHLGDTVSLATRTNATVIANFEIIQWLTGKGVQKGHPQNTGGGYRHPFGHLKFTLAEHSSSLPDGTYGGNPNGMLLKTHGGTTIYLAGDTALFSEMADLASENIDLAVLPIGDNYTMGPDDAVKAVEMIRPKSVLPVHFNTWPIISQDNTEFAAKVRARTQVHVHVIHPGDTVDV